MLEVLVKLANIVVLKLLPR